MKKIFSILVAMVLFFSVCSIVTVKATNQFDFSIDGTTLTGSNNKFTINASDGKGIAYTKVSDVDLTKDVYVSVKFASLSVTNLDVYAHNGTSYTCVAYKVTTDNTSNNLVEFQTYHEDEFTVCTVNITDQLKANNFTELAYIKYIFRGSYGDSLNILDFKVTTDGVHGFDLSEGSGTVVTEPVVPVEYTITPDDNLTVDGSVYTLKSETAYLTIGVANVNWDLSKLYVSAKYNASANFTGYETSVVGVLKDAVEPSSMYVASLVAPKTTAGSPWNLDAHMIYDDCIVSTVKIGGYTGDFASLSEVKLLLRGEVGSTFELLDFAVTEDGIHGFELPMTIDAPVGHSVTVTDNTDGTYDFSYNNATASWRSVDIFINDYKPEYDLLNITLEANAGTNIGILLHYKNGTTVASETIRDHWGEEGLVTTTGLLELSYSIEEELGSKDVILTKVELYLDPDTSITTNTGDQVVKYHGVELVNLAKVLADAKEAAIAKLTEAIGEYEIEQTAYNEAINAAENVEAVETALKAALEEIEGKITEIEAAKALQAEKDTAIEFLNNLVGDYSIDITTYVEDINKATSIAEVETICETAAGYIATKIAEIKAEQAAALAQAKVEAKAALASHKNASDYREAEKAQLQSAIEAGNTTIDACETTEAVASALDAAKAAIDALNLKTNAQYEQEEAEALAQVLAAAKLAAKAELLSYKNLDDYREAEKLQLGDALLTGNTAIDASETTEAVATALANAKAAIDALNLKTNAQYEAEALQAAKDSAKAELASYKNASDYREAEQAQLQSAIEAGNIAIDASENTEAVASALAAAKAVIDGLKTNAQYEAEEAEALAQALQAAKDSAKAELASYKKASDYREAEQLELQSAIEAGNTAIDASENTEAVASALADAKAAIDALNLKTKAQYEQEEASSGVLGCLGSLVPSLFGIVTLLGACIVVKRKREE